MNYEETLHYLFRQLPIYQREGKSAYKANLDNTIQLDNYLGNPHRSFKTIHIGGTNGKGSSSHMLASILQEAGYKVGLYTSPHLKDFRERIKINGVEIPEEDVIEFVEQHKSTFEKWSLSFFEWTVGLCFDYFRKEKVEVAIIEVGLGGRLDSTNIIDPIACLITNIGMDHQQFLGDTPQKIATEKAGIIKTNTPIVISEYQPEVATIFENTAIKKSSEIIYADKTELHEFETDLLGTYQQKNMVGVLALLPFIQRKGYLIKETHIKSGLLLVSRNTGLKGRWQILQRSPLIICDTAHNKEGLKYVIGQLNALNAPNIHLVLGFVNDKNVSEILGLFPSNAKYYLCQPTIPRALPVEDLVNLAESRSLAFQKYNQVSEALNAAKNSADTKDIIFVGGSTFVVAEVV